MSKFDVCPGESFDFFNPFLNENLTGVSGVPEIKPVTSDRAEIIETSKQVQKKLAPLHNNLRLQDQTPAIEAFKGVSEASSLAELKTAQAIFTPASEAFDQVLDARNEIVAKGQGLWDLRYFLDISCGRHGDAKLTHFWFRTESNHRILKKLSEVMQKLEKDKLEKDNLEKERAEKERAEKERTEKERAEKEKAEREKHPTLTKEQVYITFESKATNATLLLKSQVDNTEHSTQIKAGEGGAVAATGRDGNPTSNPVALFINNEGAYVITGSLTFKGDGKGHIVSADPGNSHLTVTHGKDAQHFSIAWDGKTQTTTG